jgi:hypothetical protein
MNKFFEAINNALIALDILPIDIIDMLPPKFYVIRIRFATFAVCLINRIVVHLTQKHLQFNATKFAGTGDCVTPPRR